jgi:hypothetical protein
VRRSILGPGAEVGAEADVAGSVLGEGAAARPGERLLDARVPAARAAPG